MFSRSLNGVHAKKGVECPANGGKRCDYYSYRPPTSPPALGALYEPIKKVGGYRL